MGTLALVPAQVKAMKMISIAEDFSKYPGGRYRTDGPHSGEAFREDVLRRELRNHDILTIVLDGTAGYGSSFLEEAFGGLIRHKIITVSDAFRRIRIVANSPLFQTYRRMAENYMQTAADKISAA